MTQDELARTGRVAVALCGGLMTLAGFGILLMLQYPDPQDPMSTGGHIGVTILGLAFITGGVDFIRIAVRGPKEKEAKPENVGGGAANGE